MKLLVCHSEWGATMHIPSLFLHLTKRKPEGTNEIIVGNHTVSSSIWI